MLLPAAHQSAPSSSHYGDRAALAALSGLWPTKPIRVASHDRAEQLVVGLTTMKWSAVLSGVRGLASLPAGRLAASLVVDSH